MKSIKMWFRAWLCAALVSFTVLAQAQPSEPLILGVVPQFTATETLQRWAPVIERLQAACGQRVQLQSSLSIPSFETQFQAGLFDLAYMNPYHAVMAKRAQNYIPLVRDDKQRLKGILVVAADSPYKSPQDLQDQTLAFPAPNAFGASLLMRAVLDREQGVRFTAVYAKTHSNAYRHVLTGLAGAAGGVNATLQSESPDIRSQLRVIFETRAFAPHPLTAHPRVAQTVRTCITQALLKAQASPEGQTALSSIQMPQPAAAEYARDYAPLEKLALESYVVHSASN